MRPDRTGVVIGCLAAATLIAITGAIVLIGVTPPTDPVAWLVICVSPFVVITAIAGGVFTGGR